MVFLNVFDLASAMSIPNAILCNTVFNTFGAFHAAVEVYGEEYSFYRTPNEKSCGVCKSLRPRQHPVHVYRQSIPLGATSLKDWEVRFLIRAKLSSAWRGGGYDLLHRNCIHFCDELLLCLGVNGVPSWVRGLHETGASVLGMPWPFSIIRGGVGDKPRAMEDDEEDEEREGLRSSLGDGQMCTAPSSTVAGYSCSTSALAAGAHEGLVSSSSATFGRMSLTERATYSKLEAFISANEDVQILRSGSGAGSAPFRRTS